MTKRLFGLRGASGAENTAESITKGVCDMCTSLFKLNNIAPEDVVSIQFTMTRDLDAKNPASALRCGQNEIDVSACALFCSQEAAVRGMAKGMIRVLVTAYMDEGASVRHVYINGAETLRPDFSKKTT